MEVSVQELMGESNLLDVCLDVNVEEAQTNLSVICLQLWPFCCASHQTQVSEHSIVII